MEQQRSTPAGSPPPQKRQKSLLSWVSKASTATERVPLLRRPISSSASSAPSSSSSSSYLEGPPGLYSLDADSHVLYLPGLLREEEEEEEQGEKEQSDSLFRRLREEVAWQQRDVTVFNRTTPQRRLVAYHSCREDRLLPYTYSGLTLEPERATATVMEVLRRVERAAAECCDILLPAPASSAASAFSSKGKDEPPRLFNSCLLNLYRGGSDCMGWHADDEALYYSNSCSSSAAPFGRSPSFSSSSSFPSSRGGGVGDEEIVIASASFGERRDFYLRPKPAAAARNKGKNGAEAATTGEEEQGKRKLKVRYSLGEGDVLFMLGQTQRRFQHSVPARANARGERINLTFRWNCQVGGEAPRVVCKRLSK